MAGRWLTAPAKLTVSLRIVGRRSDGYHELVAEMVSLDLADRLWVDPSGEGLEIAAEPRARAGDLRVDASNLVSRALGAVGRTAGVRLHKRIPVQGGLGGGSTDAAAILRWAGCTDPAVAATLGADVPFCVTGGRAEVSGLGERVSPLPFVARTFVLLLPPFGVDTAGVYRAWDRLNDAGRPAEPDQDDLPGENDLTAPALLVQPRLEQWGELLGEVTGRRPTLAGSGSTWFVEGEPSALGLDGRESLTLGGERGQLITARAVPAGWSDDGAGAASPLGDGTSA